MSSKLKYVYSEIGFQDELLGDDLCIGDATLDDNYNLGNEEEELLLSGGNIAVDFQDKPVNNVESDTAVPNNSVPDTPSDNIKDDQPDTVIQQDDVNDNSLIVKTIESVQSPKPVDNKDEANLTENSQTDSAKVTADQRYRDGHTERFPTERSDSAGLPNHPNIPDSLDTVVAADHPPGPFIPKKQFNNRGRRQGNFKAPNRDGRRPDGSAFNNKNFDQFRNNDLQENNRYSIDSFRPICRDARFSVDFRSTSYDDPFERFNLAGNNMRSCSMNNFDRGMRSLDFKFENRQPRLGNARAGGIYGLNDERFRPAPFPPTLKPDVKPPENFGPLQQENRRDGFNNNNNRDGRIIQENLRPPGEPFQLQSGNIRESGFVDGPLSNQRNHNPPLLNYPGNVANAPPNLPYPPRENLTLPPPTDRPHNCPPGFPPNMIGPRNNDNFKSMPPMMQESKKVLINPHFKGTVPPPHEIALQQSQMHLDRNVHNPVIPGNEQFGLRDNAPYLRKPPGNSGPVSEIELERITQQFIEEQQRCLQRAAAVAKDDYYEKTQRFIDSTSIDIRNPVNSDIDARKEYLKRKQEEFINENRLNLQRRRNNSPPRSHRSPPPPTGTRYRTSPYRRNRPRAHSPAQTRRESSGEPEDKDYRAKLLEQAEMRAKVLQAKERRRRRDAANLTEKVKPEDKTDSPTATVTKIEQEGIEADEKTTESLDVNTSNDTKSVPPPSLPIESKLSTQTEDVKSNQTVPTDNDNQETLDDMLEDDLLRLSPEEEDLLLSDDEDLPVPAKNSVSDKVKIISYPKPNTDKKTSKPAIISLKRPIVDNNTDDLRKKLTKSAETTSNAASSTVVTSRKKIVFSKEIAANNNKQENKDKTNSDSERLASNKWKPTFSEKLDLTAPIAARAISAVMRNTSDNTVGNRKVIAPKNSKPLQSLASKEADKPNGTNSGASYGSGNQAPPSTSSRRVVIPPRQKPLVVVEDDEPEPFDESPKSDKKTSASVTGLPPGMTEARLLSLCGPDVERVSVDGAGNADVSFNSIAACQRFVRRFHGRLVAACRLSVTVPT